MGFLRRVRFALLLVVVVFGSASFAKPTAAGAGTLSACVKCTGSDGFQKCITESGGDPTTTCNCYSTWIQCSIAGCSQSGLDSNYNNCVKQVGPDGRLNAAKTCDPAIVCEGEFMGGSSSSATPTPTPATPTPTATPATPTPTTTAAANPSAATRSPSPTSSSAAALPHATPLAIATALVLF